MDLNRRVFIKGAVATSVLSALPVTSRSRHSSGYISINLD